MSKNKKMYCMASFTFAFVVLILTIALSAVHPSKTYAASMDPDSITDMRSGNTEADEQDNDNNDNINKISQSES